ncbi:hypothetical protein, partial [uncultured Marivita sp.]|uniref:hypothetical protein n=1 Tax=uncultured Marivita sp. TaxID=888080 RepID=UPI002633F9F5
LRGSGNIRHGRVTKTNQPPENPERFNIDTASVLEKPQWLSMEHHKRLLYTSITRARKRVVFYRMEGLCEYSAESEAPLAA